jgi:uncharacterized protein (TIRG00374 family)
MFKKALKISKYLLFLTIGLGLLFLAFRNTDLSQLFLDLKNANYYWVIFSLLISLIAYGSRAHRWNMLIRPLGYSVKLKNTLASLMVGYLANLAIPRIGEISRCETLSRIEKIPFNILIGTVIIERLIDLIMLCLALLLTAVLKMDVLGKFIISKIIVPFKNSIFQSISPLQLLIFSLFISVSFILLFYFLWRKKNAVIASKITFFIIGIKNGVKSIKKLKSIPWFIFHTLLIWVIYFFTTYLCFFSIPATSGLGIVAGIFTLSIGGIGMSAPVQGGIGAYHYMITKGLALFGIAAKDGNTYATIVHTSQTLLVLVSGAVSMLFIFISNRRILNDHTSKNTS